MLDNNLTYSNPKANINKQAERALLTLERAQKFDLLVHLLSNLRQPLMVCGPEGIGKTTLIKTLQAHHKDDWQVCVQPASSATSFEQVITQLSAVLGLSSSTFNFDLSALRAYCSKQKVILVIDNAGELLPGLINELINFAEPLSELRLVLVMDANQLSGQSKTDLALTTCHLIELPPLTQKQCTVFLQNLSAQPDSPLAFAAINDKLVEAVYRDTRGNPGKIIAWLTKLSPQQQQQQSQNRMALWLAIAVVLAGTGWVVNSLLDTPNGYVVNEPPKIVEPVPVEPLVATVVPPVPEPAPEAIPAVIVPAAPLEVTTQAIQSTAVNLSKVAAIDVAVVSVLPRQLAKPEQPSLTLKPLPAHSPAQASVIEAKPQPVTINPVKAPAAPSINQPTTPTPPSVVKAEVVAPSVAPVAVAAKPVASKADQTLISNKPSSNSATVGDAEWIQSQPADNFTLQVMVLSTKQNVQRFMKKYAEYGDSLKYYPVNKPEQEKYVVIYGSFSSATEAMQYKASLPSEFANSMEKRFRAVQKESRR